MTDYITFTSDKEMPNWYKPWMRSQPWYPEVRIKAKELQDQQYKCDLSRAETLQKMVEFTRSLGIDYYSVEDEELVIRLPVDDEIFMMILKHSESTQE